VDGNFGDAIASSPQPRDQLEDRGSENDEMPRRVWKAMETGTGEIWLAKAKGRKGKKKKQGENEKSRK